MTYIRYRQKSDRFPGLQTFSRRQSYRRGCNGTTPRCRSRNIAKNTFAEGWLQKSYEFAGLRTAPATHRAKNTANSAFSCGMLQNAGFGTIPWGGGGRRAQGRSHIRLLDDENKSPRCLTKVKLRFPPYNGFGSEELFESGPEVQKMM